VQILPAGGCFSVVAIPCEIISRGQITITVTFTPGQKSTLANLSAWVVMQFEGPRQGTLDGWISRQFVCVRRATALTYRPEDDAALDPTAPKFVPNTHRDVLNKSPVMHIGTSPTFGALERASIAPFLGCGLERRLSAESRQALIDKADKAYTQLLLASGSAQPDSIRGSLGVLLRQLLLLEEGQVQEDVAEYCLYDIRVKRIWQHPKSKEYHISFQAPGVLENRPPVNVGDLVNLRYRDGEREANDVISMDVEVVGIEKSLLLCRMPTHEGDVKLRTKTDGWFVQFSHDPTPFRLMQKVGSLMRGCVYTLTKAPVYLCMHHSCSIAAVYS